MLDPQVSPEEITSGEVELGCESWTSFASLVTQQQCYGHCPCDCSAQQLKQRLRGTLVAAQWRGHRLNTSIALAAVHGLLGLPGRCSRSSLHSPPPSPPSPSLLGHLASVDVNCSPTYTALSDNTTTACQTAGQYRWFICLDRWLCFRGSYVDF